MFQAFQDWIKIKFGIHNKTTRPSFKEKEIWWCNLGQNIGDEENGKGEFFMRPVWLSKNLIAILDLLYRLASNSKTILFMQK